MYKVKKGSKNGYNRTIFPTRGTNFVVYGENVFCAIEVKNTSNLRSKSVNSLAAFKKDYPEAEVCLLYRGKERIFHKKVLCLPCEDFLKNLVPGEPIMF